MQLQGINSDPSAASQDCTTNLLIHFPSLEFHLRVFAYKTSPPFSHGEAARNPTKVEMYGMEDPEHMENDCAVAPLLQVYRTFVNV